MHSVHNETPEATVARLSVKLCQNKEVLQVTEQCDVLSCVSIDVLEGA